MGRATLNVIYDLLGFQSRENGERGIARYVLHLGLALERSRPGLVTQYLMHPHLPFPPGAERLIATGRVVRADRDHRARAPSAGGVLVAGSPFEDFHLRSERVFPPWARSPHWRIAGVLHDLIPAKFPDEYLPTPIDRFNYQARLMAVGGLDWLLSNSEASASDAVEMLGFDRRHITVIGAGADRRFRPSALAPNEVATELVRERLVPRLRPGYLFFPTGLDPRKNVERTIAAYGALPPELRRRHQLVLTCRVDAHSRRSLARLAAEAGASNDILVTGYVSDDVLCRLYQGAHLVVFPSLYEGFGLPVIEAMKCMAPVIVADSSSLREVQPIEEARFDPASTTSMTAAMERALTDDEFRWRLRAQEHPPFTWEIAATKAAAVIDDLLVTVGDRAGQVPRSRPRRRLAVVGPLPPEAGIIATYVRRLVDELRHHCDLTVFVDGAPDEADAPDGVGVEPVDRLDLIIRSGGAFDRVLYVIGSTAASVGTLDALRAGSGWVLLHDVHLAELYHHVHRIAPELLVEGSVGATIKTIYPQRYRESVEKMEVVPPDVAERFGILLTADVVAKAAEVIVHSSFEATLVELDTGITPVAIGSQPCPEVIDADRDEPAGPPLVSSFGACLPPPELESLLAAMAIVRREVAGTRLRFVGALDQSQRTQLIELARRVGVAGAVELLDPVDDEAREAARLETAVAVQLQRPGTESMAEVAELLASGVPTVVTDLGPLAELPAEAVVKIEPTSDAAELARAMAGLLRDRGSRDTHAQAAKDHAKASSFTQAAEILAELLFP